jgi:hypothetical protein
MSIPLLSQQSPFIDRSTILNIPKQSGNYGTSVIDYNNDGWEDIFIANVPDLTGTDTSHCVLLKNNAGENFTNTAVAAGISVFGSFKCGVWGDVNNDGFPDLFIAESYQNGRCRLFINNKNGTFRDAGTSAGINTSATGSTAAFGDYDNDGRIDLFIATEYPEFDLLYRNISHGDTVQFQDVTMTAGVGGFSSTAPMQATFIDIDHDGDQDLYAVHDGFLPSNLFRNNGDGTFTDISGVTGLQDYGAGNSMGVYWKDFDFDGWEEVYVSRIGQAGLYKRQPNGKYSNIADSVGAAFNGMTWGVVWEDFDNDADDDLFMVNTFGYNGVKSLYYENVNGKFLERGAEYGVSFAHAFFGLAYGDFNNDGYLDLVASATDGNNKLLLNTKNRTGHWVKLSLTGTTVNTMAVGATVRIIAGGIQQIRTITAGNSYASQMSPMLHFGLGPRTVIDSLEIRWSSNSRQVFTQVKPDEHYRITQGGMLITAARPRTEASSPGTFALLQNFPNPFNPVTTIRFSLPRSSDNGTSTVHLQVFTLLGQHVATLYEGSVVAGKEYRQTFDAADLPTGIYIARLSTPRTTLNQKMLLLK